MVEVKSVEFDRDFLRLIARHIHLSIKLMIVRQSKSKTEEEKPICRKE